MKVNEFLQEIKGLFGDIEYRATSATGQVFKSRGYDDRVQVKQNQQTKSDLADW